MRWMTTTMKTAKKGEDTRTIPTQQNITFIIKKEDVVPKHIRSLVIGDTSLSNKPNN